MLFTKMNQQPGNDPIIIHLNKICDIVPQEKGSLIYYRVTAKDEDAEYCSVSQTVGEVIDILESAGVYFDYDKVVADKMVTAEVVAAECNNLWGLGRN